MGLPQACLQNSQSRPKRLQETIDYTMIFALLSNKNQK